MGAPSADGGAAGAVAGVRTWLTQPTSTAGSKALAMAAAPSGSKPAAPARVRCAPSPPQTPIWAGQIH